jgi:hypothetical protein
MVVRAVHGQRERATTVDLSIEIRLPLIPFAMPR